MTIWWNEMTDHYEYSCLVGELLCINLKADFNVTAQYWRCLRSTSIWLRLGNAGSVNSVTCWLINSDDRFLSTLVSLFLLWLWGSCLLASNTAPPLFFVCITVSAMRTRGVKLQPQNVSVMMTSFQRLNVPNYTHCVWVWKLGGGYASSLVVTSYTPPSPLPRGPPVLCLCVSCEGAAAGR